MRLLAFFWDRPPNNVYADLYIHARTLIPRSEIQAHLALLLEQGFITAVEQQVGPGGGMGTYYKLVTGITVETLIIARPSTSAD